VSIAGQRVQHFRIDIVAQRCRLQVLPELAKHILSIDHWQRKMEKEKTGYHIGDF
jgi:hypothetical protein